MAKPKVKTNVVKKEWTIPVVRKSDGVVMLMPIFAESYSAAKLLIPEGFMFDEDSPRKSTKVAEE